MFDLTGKTALVTGSSRGIGRAVALCLAEAGADVVVHCTGRPEKAQEVVDAIRAMGRKAWFIQKNLMDEDCAEYIFSRLEQPLDILVLNASIQYRKAWEQITAQDFAEQINVNLRASMLLIQKAVPHMREQHWGRIVTVGSVQEAKPHPDMLVYSASKAGQRMMAQSLAGQLAKDGITVNNMAPGVIATDRNVEALSDPVYARQVADSIPVGFYGEPQDCAGAVLLLCSEEGRYITGQSLYVDGGKCL
ncbi:MAG: SDR family oxidoreductase [bacterium]|nr:SDR family oxidoreductase [bacterium]